MNFLNPFVLIGLVAAGIPILLHLLNLRRMKTVEFSTLRFLKELQKTKIRRLKLKQIILLILRTLIIIFAVLAFARPTIEGTIPGLESYAKTSAVVIVDNSFSMDVSDEFGNRFIQSKNAALQVLGQLREGDEVTILRMADPYNVNKMSFSRNFEYIRDEITKLKIVNTVSDLNGTLRSAAALMEDATNLNHEIYIISDFQNNIFTGLEEDTTGLFDESITIYPVPIGFESRTEINNLSVDSLNIVSRIFQIERLVEVEANIKNYSEKDAEDLVTTLVFNSNRVSQRSLDIPAGEIRNITIGAEPQSKGIYRCSMELENDALDADNRRYFGFVIPEKPDVAVIGEQNSIEFIRIALSGSDEFESPANLSTFTPDQFSAIDPADFDIILFASGSIRATDLKRIETFVFNGGSALIFAEENISGNNFEELIANLGFGIIDKKQFSRSEPAAFSSVDKMHPLFEGVFKGTTDRRAIVESPDIFLALANSGGQPLIEMPGGNFLSESAYGEGKALYVSVSPDLGWSTLPLTGLFPTILYRSIVYLSSSEDLGRSVEAGEPLVLSLPKKFASGGNFKVIDPSGTEFFQQAAILPSGASLSFEPFRQLGVYSVESATGKTVALISVNPPASESILDSPDDSRISSLLKNASGDNANVMFVDKPNEISADIFRARTGTELWQLFLFLALLCAAAEMIVQRTAKSDSAE